MPKTRLQFVLVLLLFTSFGVSQSLKADTIGLGQTTSTPTDFTNISGNLTYVASTTLGSIDPLVSLISAVYSGTDGSLFFMYQIVDGSRAITPFAVTNFAGFTTDVGFITSPGSLASNPFSPPLGNSDFSVSRSGSLDGGGTITFSGNGGVLTYTNSDVFVIHTDATRYGSNGTFSQMVLAPYSGLVSGSGSFEPVPEPGTLMLFGTGLLSLAGFFRRKIMS